MLKHGYVKPKTDIWSLYKNIDSTLDILYESRSKALSDLEKQKYCTDCNDKLKLDNLTNYCDRCTMLNNAQLNDNYDTSASKTIFNIKGPYFISRPLQNASIIRSSVYPETRKIKDYKRIKSKCTGLDCKYIISKNIIERASQIMSKICSFGNIHRENVRDGLLIACCFFAGIEYGEYIPIDALAVNFGLHIKYVNSGISTIHMYNAQNNIDLDININKSLDSIIITVNIKKIAHLVSLVDVYNDPVICNDMILRAENKCDIGTVNALNQKFIITRCIGVIYTFYKCKSNFDLPSEFYAIFCIGNITISSLESVYEVVKSNPEAFRLIFKKNQIPTPWNDELYKQSANYQRRKLMKQKRNNRSEK